MDSTRGSLDTSEEVLLEISGLDALADLEVCLYNVFPLLMIFSGYETSVASGLS